MNLDRYTFTAGKKQTTYEFVSEGQNGRIRKVIVFKLINPKLQLYNLGFGDYSESTKKVNDLSVSNNKDRDKILATVAAAVEDFMGKHSDATLIAIGSTPARTRLYRMGITRHFENISANFSVEGFNGKWEPFVKGRHYEAFSLTRKNA